MGIRLLFGCVTGLMIAIGAAANAETVVEPILLPESLRLPLEVDHEEPASAEEPANVRDPAVHPDDVLKSLQESAQRLMVAGLEDEAAAATRLLKQFEQKHDARLKLELQSAQSAKHRSELDRLQRRLAMFDIDAELERRIQLASKLRTYEGKSTEVRYWVRDNGVDHITQPEQRSLNTVQFLEDPVRIPGQLYEKSVHLIDEVTATRRLLESINRTKDDYPVLR